MNNIVSVSNLKKSYGSIEAVKGISFEMEEGSLFAFLGPNGAGKSTTIDIITTFLKPDCGMVSVDGYILGQDNHQIRKTIGAVFQQGLLDDALSVIENLQVRGSLYGLHGTSLNDRVQQAIRLCALQDIQTRRYGRLSGGQRRRCDIARALLINPKILFLDEPTTGLDPQTRQNIWQVIRTLQIEEGLSVFLTTHYMEEAAEANHVIIMDDGMIKAQGTPAQLKAQYAHDTLVLYPHQMDTFEQHLQHQQLDYQRMDTSYYIALQTTMDALTILPGLQNHLHAFEVVHGTLDDAFIAIIGKDLRE